MIIKEEILKTAENFFSETLEYRRHIHRNPELSFCETETSQYIRERLNEFGIVSETLSGNSVVAVIRGNKHDKVIGLRADIDALPINEKNKCDFVSQNDGVMHACGHDAHTASMITTAKILNKFKGELNGDVVIIFQHAEEKLPGGAIELIEKGLFEKYKIRIMLGQHVQPGISTGVFGFKPGKYMASTDELYITFTGKGGHAALPAERSDTVLATADFLIEVQKRFSKIKINNLPSVLAFGKLEALGAVNIIPENSIAHGTLRCFDESQRKTAKTLIKQTAEECAKKYSCTADANIVDGYPHVYNNEELTKDVIGFAKELLGDENIIPLDLRLTAEDFSYYSHKVPSVFYRMGITGNGLGNSRLHAADFNIDEESLKTAPALMTWLAYKVLKEQK